MGNLLYHQFYLSISKNNFKLFFLGIQCDNYEGSLKDFASARTSRSRVQSNEDSALRFSGDLRNCSQSAFTSTEAPTSHNGTYSNKVSLKRFNCNLCPYFTNSKGNLKRHHLVHSGKRPYKCEMCNLAFTQLPNLTRHRLLHTGEKPYLCDVCHMSFRQVMHLKLHKNRHHL